MELGLAAMNYGTCADPDTAVRVAQAAEAAGFESLWTAEHAVLPHPRSPDFHLPPDLPWLDSIAALTMLAVATERIRIGSGTIELPMHSPVRLAKQLASIDVISGGRLICGFGLGYLEVEFASVGVDISERGLRMDEGLDVLAEMWTGDPPRYRGQTVSLEGIDAHPRPLQAGGPPIILGGGSTPRARRRIITRAHGWYLYDVEAADVEAALTLITTEMERWERPAELGRLEITVTPAEALDPGLLRRYRDLGVDRLVLLPGMGATPGERHHPVPEAEIVRTIEKAAAMS